MANEYIYILDTGTTTVDTSTMLARVQSEWRDAISQNLNVRASTPQGTLIAAETIARVGVMKNNAELANLINPNLSYGSFLDAVCSFLGVERSVNRTTSGTGVQVSGNSQTAILAGSRVQSVNGDVFQVVASVTIPQSGSTFVSIEAVNPGPIALPVGDMTIVDGTIGWGAITVLSTSVITLGVSSLTDPQLKNSRNKRLAALGKSSTLAIQAAAMGVANVTSVKVIENNTGAAGTVNGVKFTLPNAMWVCVDGSYNSQDVADALYGAHNAGCPWDFGTGAGVPVSSPNGVRTVDPASGIGYFVKWCSPVLYDAYVIANVRVGTNSTSPVEGVQNAILDYARGNIAGEEGFVIGADISGYELAGAISNTQPGLYVKSVQVACVTAGSAAPAASAYTSEFVMNPFWRAQLAVGNIKVNLL